MTINDYREGRLAKPYVSVLNRMGWFWTMSLIDEDIELFGERDNHEAEGTVTHDKGTCAVHNLPIGSSLECELDYGAAD